MNNRLDWIFVKVLERMNRYQLNSERKQQSLTDF